MAFGACKELFVSTAWWKDFGRNKEKETNMTKQFLKDAFLWGFLLWIIGYILGIVLFAIVPRDLIGWIIMPIGVAIILWVLLKKINGNTFKYYLLLAISWTIIAMAFDYFFLVKVFNPTDGYYKLDVYLYYAFTFVSPLFVGWKKVAKK